MMFKFGDLLRDVATKRYNVIIIVCPNYEALHLFARGFYEYLVDTYAMSPTRKLNASEVSFLFANECSVRIMPRSLFKGDTTTRGLDNVSVTNMDDYEETNART